jgi:hypothetical protein
LKNYVEVNIVSRNRSLEGSKFTVASFRNCEKKDYLDNGIPRSHVEGTNALFDGRLCPNMNDEFKHYNVKNGYSNLKDRLSFSVEIWKCNKKMNANCKEDEEIERLLNVTYYTI